MSRANWTPINGTGESINQMSRPLMRARARDAERNSDITNGILLAYRRNVVGKGFTLQATSFDEDFNLEAEKVWRRWCKAKNCDITGKQSLREILNMLVERTIVDGGLILVKTIVKGDSLSASIAAASILAKVTRDRLMEQLDASYPES